MHKLVKLKKKDLKGFFHGSSSHVCFWVSICHLPSRSRLWSECQRSSGLWGVWPIWPEPSSWPTLLEHDVTSPKHTHLYVLCTRWWVCDSCISQFGGGGGAKGGPLTTRSSKPARTFTHVYDGWATTEADIIGIFVITDPFKYTECRNKQSTDTAKFFHVNKTFAAEELRLSLGTVHRDQK